MAMRRLVGKAKAKAPPPSLEDTSKKLGDMGESLDTKIKREENELKKIKIKMKGAKGPAKVALQKRGVIILKRLKEMEKRRDNLAQQTFNLDQQSYNLESMKATHETIAAMKETSKVMKKQMKKLNIDKIEDLKDNIEELMEDNEEIQEVLGQNDTLEDIDEADLDAELEALDEFDDEQLDNLEGNNVPSYLQDDNMPTSLPAVPLGKDDEFGLPASPVPERQAAGPTSL